MNIIKLYPSSIFSLTTQKACSKSDSQNCQLVLQFFSLFFVGEGGSQFWKYTEVSDNGDSFTNWTRPEVSVIQQAFCIKNLLRLNKIKFPRFNCMFMVLMMVMMFQLYWLNLYCSSLLFHIVLYCFLERTLFCYFFKKQNESLYSYRCIIKETNTLSTEACYTKSRKHKA